PKIPQASLELGELELQAGNLQEAIECFERVVKMDQYNVSAHFQLADALRKAGRRGGANEVEERRKQLEKDDPRFSKILEDVQATRDSSKIAALHYDAGEILLRKGAIDRAIIAFRTALLKDPWHVASHKKLIELYERKGNQKEVEYHKEELEKSKRARQER